MRKSILLLLILVVSQQIITAYGQDYASKTLTLEVLSDGTTNVEYQIKPDPFLAKVNVSLPGKAYTDLLAVDENGVILDWEPIANGIEVDSIGSEEITIFYSSTALTNKTGSVWTVSVYSEISINYILPTDSVLVSLSSSPLLLSVLDNRVTITMAQGVSKISYTIGETGTKEHSILLLFQAEEKIAEANQLGIDTTEFGEMLYSAEQAYESGSYINSEELSQQVVKQCSEIIEYATKANEQIISAQELLKQKINIVSNQISNEVEVKLEKANTNYDLGDYSSAYSLATEAIQLLQQQTDTNQQSYPYVPLFLFIGGIGGIGGVVLFYRRSNSTVSAEVTPHVDLAKVFKYKDNLRTDEKAVLRFIEESGGAFISDIRERFDIPKSSAWRMVKRLSEEDLVAVSTVGRETYLELREPETIR